jgi:hypothetical protein
MSELMPAISSTLLPFGKQLAVSTGLIFLWQEDFFVACATPARRASVRRVHPGEQVVGIACDELHGSVSSAPGGNQRISAGSRISLEECRSLGRASFFGELVTRTARRVDVEPRALVVRALLHLPRVASQNGWMTRREVEQELEIIGDRLRLDVLAARAHVPHEKFALCELAFEKIDSSRALPVLTLLHYLQSARPGSLYFALVDPIGRLPVTLCGVSPLEWKRVASRISAQFDIPPGGVWDVSRVYSIDGAPPNAISALLSRVRTYMRRHMSTVDLLVTAVDPNLGFTGGSYRAANWQQWMTVSARPYLYENGHYVSPRQLRERYGTGSLDELQIRFPGIFQKSKVRLLDSMIFCSNINEKTKVVPAHEMRRLHR